MAIVITLHHENGLAFRLNLDSIESVEHRDGVTEVLVDDGSVFRVLEKPEDVFSYMKRTWGSGIHDHRAPPREVKH